MEVKPDKWCKRQMHSNHAVIDAAKNFTQHHLKRSKFIAIDHQIRFQQKHHVFEWQVVFWRLPF